MSTLEGEAALQRRLKAIKEGHSLLREIQLGAVREAKLLVPRKTGNLGRSIVPGSIGRTTAIVEARAAYAAYVELGTARGRRPRPADACRAAPGRVPP
jgi:phage gpG-like protein